MSLDLFVNFERASNSSLFYRVTSSTPSVFTVKLSDLSFPQLTLNASYQAEYAINGGTFSIFNPNANGDFVLDLTFNTALPCVCSINVNVSTAGSLFANFSLSGVFVDKFPSIDFIAYPSTYIDLETKTLKSLNQTNYYTSPGVNFYGEGHTETVNLSANGLTVGTTPNWFVGNTLQNIPNHSSFVAVSSQSISTASVRLTTTSMDSRSYPISLWATNDRITTKGPFITYNDVTGAPAFYPFFNSTTNVDGTETRTNIKGHINVLPYPVPVSHIFVSPFATSEFTLPLDYSFSTFTGLLIKTDDTNVLTEDFIGSQWELQTTHIDEIAIRERTSITTFLSDILAYQFKMSYSSSAEDLLVPFYVSPGADSTVLLSVSSFQDIVIDLSPYDWIKRRNCLTHSATAVIAPIPSVKIYTPNFYNVKNQDVTFTIIDLPEYPLILESLSLASDFSVGALILSQSQLSGTMQFNKVGVVSLSAATVLRNVSTNLTQEFTNIWPNIIETISSYDDAPNEQYFQTSLTPLQLSYKEQPQLTPNEWAIADNVNSIIEKIYTTIQELDRYTKLYEKKDKFYGWNGSPTITFNKTWLDHECPDFAEEENASWAQFEPIEEFNTWASHECYGIQTDPTCLQKYCLEWKWRSRKYNATEVNTTWASTKLNNEYAKKWSFESCAIDSTPLNCTRDNWKIATIDAQTFNKNLCEPMQRCQVVDYEVNPITNQVVLASLTEINLIENDYYATPIARRGIADGYFAFQNIVGISFDASGKLAVLDSTIPRVSIFKIVDNRFVLVTTWGSFGYTTNSQGFNQPSDIHVDKKNSVWIADTGNNCIKKLTLNGKHLMTITHEKLEANAPLSVCVDSQLNVHCLTELGVLVFDQYGNYAFEYKLQSDVYNVKKINTSFNREMIYITYAEGVVKYFRTGTISHYTIKDLKCSTTNNVIQNYNSVFQDKFRNLYITSNDKVLKVADLQKIVESKASLPSDLYWPLDKILIHKEEYIQPWVYLKSFHRLWDNIELLRNSLFYELEGCKAYTAPTYTKTDLIIGQNEIVSNAVINRLSEQLWTNLQSLIDYFDPDC